MNKVVLTINGIEKEYAFGTKYEEIAKEYRKDYDNDIILVKLNERYRELSKPAIKNGRLSFITVNDKLGFRAYRRTLTFLALKAAYEINERYDISKICVEHTLGSGLYCRVKGKGKVNEAFIAELKSRMEALVEADLPIVKSCINTEDAISLFAERGMDDKVRLLKYRRATKVNVYELDGYVDYCYDLMLPSTGYIKYYDVFSYKDGFIINMPTAKEPESIKPLACNDKFFSIQRESNEWGALMGVETAADLNDYITHNDINHLILIQEALQEKKIGAIAEDIYRKGKRIVLIAGPSSSGKTTFSHRLSIQLETLGLKPHPIPVDDYFINRADMIPLPDNTLDFEALDAVDVKLFNDDMSALLEGKRVEIPTYNFKTGKREYKGHFEELKENDVLVVEGIHCMNEKLSYALPKEEKYKIYISALTTLNIDDHNRIPTTDVRLLRRMIRDARTRGADAKATLERWDSVRRGEDNNIFPFQEDADAMFNSALIYELAVIKPYAEAALFSVDCNDPQYQTARNLLKFLEFFVTIDSKSVPQNSILSEFIGGGSFDI